METMMVSSSLMASFMFKIDFIVWKLTDEDTAVLHHELV